MSTTNQNSNTYQWCDTCRRSYRNQETHHGRCPVCDNETRPIGKYQAIVRGLMSNELSTSEIYTKHRQIIRMIWTRNGMGEQYYRALGPEISYSKFESRVTELLCRGAHEGWVTFVLPPAPVGNDNAYRIEFGDENRFIDELTIEFAAEIPQDA